MANETAKAPQPLPMETNTSVSSGMESSTATAPLPGDQIQNGLVTNTLVGGRMENETATAPIQGSMEANTLVSGGMVLPMVKALRPHRMDPFNGADGPMVDFWDPKSDKDETITHSPTPVRVVRCSVAGLHAELGARVY